MKEVTPEAWWFMKPYRTHAPTDAYYRRVAGRLQEALSQQGPDCVWLQTVEQQGEEAQLACFLASYLEDVVSGTRLWHTFVQTHTEAYGQALPFYDTADGYYPDEINTEDVLVLLWLYFNQRVPQHYLSSDSAALHAMAALVMDILDAEYDYAPVNTKLKAYYQLPPGTADYSQANRLVETLLFGSYLFAPDSGWRLLYNEYMIAQQNDDPAFRDFSIQTLRCALMYDHATWLMAYKGSEWAARLLGSEHPLYDAMRNFGHLIRGYFFIGKRDKDHLALEHLGSGKRFTVRVEPIEQALQSIEDDEGVVYTNLLHWQGEWWPATSFTMVPYDEELLQKETKSADRYWPIALLEEDRAQTRQRLQDYLRVFRQLTRGAPVTFLPPHQFQAFFTQLLASYHQYRVEQGRPEPMRSRQAPPEEEEEEGEEAEVLFFNPNYGMESYQGVVSAFPMANNPYYRPEESDEAARRLLFEGFSSPELLSVWVEQCQDRLPFFQTAPGRDFLTNQDFMTRFFSRNYYYRPPMLSMIDPDTAASMEE